VTVGSGGSSTHKLVIYLITFACMNDLKSYARRCLNRLGLDEPARKRWARHGSTRWLWKPESVSAGIRYVVDEQGDSLSVFEVLEL
jgi:hypothetical protein